MQIFNPSQDQVFIDSIDTYGKECQLDQMQEEAIELSLAIRKYKRAVQGVAYNEPGAVEIREKELISEIADVIIMTTQCRLIFNDEAIQAEIRRKLDRQAQRIKNRKENNKF